MKKVTAKIAKFTDTEMVEILSGSSEAQKLVNGLALESTLTTKQAIETLSKISDDIKGASNWEKTRSVASVIEHAKAINAFMTHSTASKEQNNVFCQKMIANLEGLAWKLMNRYIMTF